MKALDLVRYEVEETHTHGDFVRDGQPVCRCLELPWKANARDVSCIPAGEYAARYNPAKNKIEVYNVPDRDNIQIHIGNDIAPAPPKEPDSLGCLLPGMDFVSHTFITKSAEAFDTLKEIVGEEKFVLRVKDLTGKTRLAYEYKILPRKAWKDIAKPDLEPLAVPDDVEIGQPWYIVFKKYLTLQRLIGVATVVGGWIKKSPQLVEWGLGILGIDLVKSGYDSKPSVNGDKGRLYSLIERIIRFLQDILKLSKG